MSRNDGGADADPVGGHVAGNRLMQWVLFEGDRELLAALSSVGVFLLLAVFAVLAPTSFRSLMAATPTEPLFQAILISVVTGVTLVVTIAQLVLSQEFGTASDKQRQMDGAMDFQRSVEGLIDDAVAPVPSADFLRALVAASGDRAAAVESAATGVSDDRLRERIEQYAATVQDDAASVGDALADAGSHTFPVVLAALHFDYTEKIQQARRLQQEPTADLPGPTRERLDDLVETLTYFASAREHVKTLYFQGELINLARGVVYAALPALLVAIGMVLYGDSLTEFTGQVAGVDVLVWLVSAAVTATVIPFLLLLAYILRIVTVTQLTLAIGPIELQETVRTGDTE